MVFTTISGDSYEGNDAGDLWITAWDLKTNALVHHELHDKFQRDDHDVAALHELPDGRILAVYAKHNTDRLQRSAITAKPGDISSWTEESEFDVGAGLTYSNVYQLSAGNNRIYNFHRGRGFNPNCSFSDDLGRTWKYGWRLFSWTSADLKGDPRYTGIDGSRPYLRYASNNVDTIHFVTSDDHPRAYDNSIYHGSYKQGNLLDSYGKVLGAVREGDDTSPLKPNSFTEIFKGDKDHVAWTTDLELDAAGNPVTIFSVQRDGAADRGKRGAARDGNDHRFHYGRFDGKKWNVHELAYAGSRIYPKEDDYTGLAAIDPQDPDTVVISTNADPVTGNPLISHRDRERHWELFRGHTTDGGATWTWNAITRDSTSDNLRPNIPSNPGGKRIILWCRGTLKTFTDFRLDVCGMTDNR